MENVIASDIPPASLFLDSVLPGRMHEKVSMMMQDELCKPDNEVDRDYIEMVNSALMGYRINWLKRVSLVDHVISLVSHDVCHL